MHLENDQELIKKIVDQNDRYSFDQIITKYKKMVFGLCFSLLFNREDAEDCAQDVFVNVYRNLKKFQFKSEFSTWLYRITVNVCKNKINSKEYRTRKKLIDLNGKNKDGKEYIEPEDKNENIEIKAEMEEENIRVRKAIMDLEFEKKTILTLRDIEKRSYEEICKITGMKLGTLKSKLARARETLRNNLKEVWDEMQ